jgi:hypothetical protein
VNRRVGGVDDERLVQVGLEVAAINAIRELVVIGYVERIDNDSALSFETTDGLLDEPFDLGINSGESM